MRKNIVIAGLTISATLLTGCASILQKKEPIELSNQANVIVAENIKIIVNDKYMYLGTNKRDVYQEYSRVGTGGETHKYISILYKNKESNDLLVVESNSMTKQRSYITPQSHLNGKQYSQASFLVDNKRMFRQTGFDGQWINNEQLYQYVAKFDDNQAFRKGVNFDGVTFSGVTNKSEIGVYSVSTGKPLDIDDVVEFSILN